MPQTVRLELEISSQLNEDLQGFVGAGADAIAKFIESAVRKEMFHRTVQQIKKVFADADQDELQTSIDRSLLEVRQERAAKQVSVPMRVVLDTNIFVSALVSSGGPPDLVYRAWLVQRFDLLTCHRQVEELRETLHKPFFSGRLHPHVIGRLINDLQDMAIGIDPLPRVVRSSDPDDDFLLALAQAGRADYLVSGDKSGLLALRKHAGASIVTARAFVDRLS